MLSRHGSNLARPVIIHDIIHDDMMCQVLHVVDFLGSRRMETAPTSIEVILRPAQSQSDEPSDLRGSLSPTSIYSTWQSQGFTHPIMNRARRCLTSVIEHNRHTHYPKNNSMCRIIKILMILNIIAIFTGCVTYCYWCSQRISYLDLNSTLQFYMKVFLNLRAKTK